MSKNRIAMIDADKACKVCEVIKPLSEFAKNEQCTTDGHIGTCKRCVRERTRQWNQDNKERRQIDARDRKRKSKYYAVQKFGDKCGDCGNTFPIACYDFHHKDASTKEKNPSALFGMTKDRLDKELDKCVMLCANCHRIHHFGDTSLVDVVKEVVPCP